MDLLPTLASDQIFTLLDVSDLLSCSLVSVGWRAAVNSDCVWKRVCHRESNDTTIQYLQEVPSKVSPVFEEPESLHKRLEALCYWRILYLKLQHLKRNWRAANHETYNVTDFAFNHYDLKIDRDLLVANVNDNQCEVWNIRGVPKKQEVIVCALKNTRCKCMIHLCGNRLIIVQDTLLQVYCKEGKQFKLNYRRLFNLHEDASSAIPGSVNIDDWYNELIKRRPTHLQAFHVGKFFIGVALNGTYENATFHVWNTFTGSKLKEELLKGFSPELCDPVYNVKFCPPRTELDKILVCIQHSRQNGSAFYTVVYVYDLPSLTFKRLSILKPHASWIYYEDHLMLTIGHCQAKLTIYSSTSGEKLIAKRYEEIINPDSVQVRGDLLGFTTGGDLVVLNVKDFDLVFTTAIVKFSSNIFGFDFVFLDFNLVLMSRWDKVNKIEVWSIDEKRFLRSLNATGIMFPCNNSAKFFVWNEMVTTIYMMQFW